MNKKLLAVLIGTLMATSAAAECIMRSNATSQITGKIDDIADITPFAVAGFNGERKCSIRARVLHKGAWHTIFGDYSGNANEQELCRNAVTLGVKQFLASKAETKVVSENTMVCSDEPEIKPRPVQKGELVRISEVLPHPDQPRAFLHKGVECRYFLEATGQGTNYYRWTGIVCRTGRNGSDEWTVVDKY